MKVKLNRSKLQTVEAALGMCCGGRQALREEFQQAGVCSSLPPLPGTVHCLTCKSR